MVKDNSQKSTFISLFLHIGIIALLLVFSKPISILVPSRSNGMEVSLVAMPSQTIVPYEPKIKVNHPALIETQDRQAQINIKQENKRSTPKSNIHPTLPPKNSPAKKVKPPLHASDKTPAPTSTNTKTKIRKKQKVQVNDLLGDVMSNSTTAIRKGKALGGNPSGTSDSNNLIGNYADQVINAVRPFVIIPDDINPDAKAIVKVELDPDLSVNNVILLKSSGNPVYDQNVQNAIYRVKVFPPLPDGAKYIDFRILKLTFRPQ